jgi:mono/diheme cytochrome c family protein
MMKRLLIMLSGLALATFCSTALAVDQAAGEATFKAQCAECHYVDDFAGESAANLIVLITEDDTLAAHEGKANLKALSPDNVASLAEYLANAQ